MIYQTSGWKTNGETVYNKSIKAYIRPKKKKKKLKLILSLAYIAASCSSLWEPIKSIQRYKYVITE